MFLKNLFLHNWLKLLYLNFRVLPFSQAIHLPIDIYGPIRFWNIRGNIKIIGPIKTGMIKLGSQGRDMFARNPVILDIRGSLIIKGSFSLGCGSCLRVEDSGKLTIGHNVRFGAECLLFCEESIDIENEVGVSWRVQVMDTDRHEILDVENSTVLPMRKPIKIHSRVWIGNNVIINKGTVIPSYLIVASDSLLNKDYSNINRDSIIGGIPAHVLSVHKRRLSFNESSY